MIKNPYPIPILPQVFFINSIFKPLISFRIVTDNPILDQNSLISIISQTKLLENHNLYSAILI